MRPKTTPESFITKAQAVHGLGTYDYSPTAFIGTLAKVWIKCATHGPFHQQAGSHLTGYGCPKCKDSRKFPASKMPTAESFIGKATQLHGGKYNYSACEYKRSSAPVAVTCATHGLFRIRADKHLLGQGCPQCAKGKEKKRRKHVSAARKAKVEASFIAKCRELSPELDFSETVFADYGELVTIICPAHGRKTKLSQLLLKGRGCPDCAFECKVKLQLTDRTAFTEKAQTAHGARYDYESLPNAFALHDKVTIVCPQHGPFLQNAGSHLQGSGCSACNLTGWGKDKWVARAKGKSALLYVVKMAHGDEVFYKAGITLRALQKRLTMIKPYVAHVVCVFTHLDAGVVWQTERDLKNKKDLPRYSPAFHFGGHSECYASLPEIINAIKAAGLNSYEGP